MNFQNRMNAEQTTSVVRDVYRITSLPIPVEPTLVNELDVVDTYDTPTQLPAVSMMRDDASSDDGTEDNSVDLSSLSLFCELYNDFDGYRLKHGVIDRDQCAQSRER